MSARSFKVKLGNGFVELPFDVKKEFGKARLPVRISVNGYSYQSTVAVYGDKYYVPVRRDRREAAGVEVGDIVEVTIAPDKEVRKVDPPPELRAVLERNSAARAQWERLSYTLKREHAEAILQAKQPETRARRVQKILQKLTGNMR
jgi:bifunctional DNA-binding transcriptional regulator/antitoxin component of YhaV-PrlF toxin-antitoxin module